jgi:hypothetical protein
MIIMAIDPGLKGGVAVLRTDVYRTMVDSPVFDFGTWPMPVVRYAYGRDRRQRGKIVENVDVATLHWMATMHHVDEIVTEQQTAMPRQGAPSAATTFTNYGLILSLRLLRPVHIVHPATWKAKLKVPSDKKEATKRCAELFPGLETPTQDGPAEALMIALYWNNVVRTDAGSNQAELRRLGALGKAKAVRGGFPAGTQGSGGAAGRMGDPRPGRLGLAGSPR